MVTCCMWQVIPNLEGGIFYGIQEKIYFNVDISKNTKGSL